MSNFSDFKIAVERRFKLLEDTGLFFTDTNKDDLWECYLGSFPEGSNPLYKERSTHDCQCCKQFIRACGSVVSIIDGELVSIWDINIGGDYQVVADALSLLVRSSEIKNKYLHYENNLGTDHNNQALKDGQIKTWEHFHHKLNSNYIVGKFDIDSNLGSHRTSVQTFKRALEEIAIDSIETVLELISQNSLYRGQEHEETLTRFFRHKDKYDKLNSVYKETYIWSNYDRNVAGIRNSSIGTLLTDLSEGKELDYAVSKFERMVAPANYKRPTALITKGMIDKAEQKADELGLHDSFKRRYANMDDLTINNVIFANRDTKKSMNAFDEIKSEVAVDTKKFSNVEEIGIDKFVSDILPNINKLEMMFTNIHSNNLVSLIAPTIPDSPNILKWGNNFSWSYNGEVTDSIKDRVKNAGGQIDAYMRCSLSWFNFDDLDIHVIEPNGQQIYYGNKHSCKTGGELDVDMNAGGQRTRNAVENIVWVDKNKMEEGNYKVVINNYTARETIDIGFEVEIEFDGQTMSFCYNKRVTKDVDVLTFNYSKENGITILKSLPESKMTKELWDINTNNFHNVSMVMNSPNHWDGEKTGNKHWFFMLDKCNNDKQARGFYNEFLSNELHEHRKVFEMLGSKLKTELSDNQLSGLGFSATKRDSVLCKVYGSFDRVVKINF